jgi:hypothetical protein
MPKTITVAAAGVPSGVVRVCSIVTGLQLLVAAGSAQADGGDGGGVDLGPGGPCGAVTIKGCCEGALLRYCVAGALKSEDCGKSPSCGWRADKAFYACGTSGAADPTGKHPKVCPAPVDAGVDGAADVGPADAGAADVGASDATFDGARDGARDQAGQDGVVWKPPDQGRLDVAAADARPDSRGGASQTRGGCGCRAAGGASALWADVSALWADVSAMWIVLLLACVGALRRRAGDRP